uniref:LRAT domain-containing protein n=1 Tax=Cyanoderma ruficeps TaxID=181631 RepID=A0A8C3QFR5_9PASS
MSVGSSSNSTGTAKVKKELLRKVAGNSEWSVNNKYDKLHTPLPVEKIVQNAERLIDMEIPYNLLKDNCEHFVTLLRYDNKISDQVNNAIYLSSALLAFSLIVITIPMSISLAKKRKKYAGTAQGVQNEEGEIDVCPQLAEDENAERKTHDDLTEKVALLTTEILDTLSQTYVRNIK